MLGELLTIFALILFAILSMVLLHKFWNRISSCFHSHYTYSKVFFVAIYSIEQAIFIIASFLFKEQSDFYPIIVSFFALIVLTTTNLQGMMLEATNTNTKNAFHEIKQNYTEETSKLKHYYEGKIFGLQGYICWLENKLSNDEKRK